MVRRSMLQGLVLGGLALTACCFSGMAGTPEPPAAATDSTTQPMHFGLMTEGPSDACGARCRPLIAASGMITSDTARQFQAFIRDSAVQGVAGAVVVLQSDGGSVLGALDLGRAIRRFGFATTVGRVLERRGKAGAKYAELVARADCQSMCTFVLLGGAQREVPPDARVLVHQIWLGDRRDDAVAANYSAEDLVVVQRDIGSIMQYTVEMGGDVELVALSLKVPPWEPMRALSRDEMRRTRLVLAGDVGEAPALIKTAAGPATVPEDGTLINGRGWVPLTRAGQPALGRTHPLTFEGERLGSFDLTIACGTAPETFALTYHEVRSGSAERGLPRAITRIALMIEDHVQPLRIGSSEKKMRRGDMESVASAMLPAALVRTLAGDGPASMTLETESTGNPRTVIRVGNAGFGRNFQDLEKSCAQASRGRTDVRVQADARSLAQ